MKKHESQQKRIPSMLLSAVTKNDKKTLEWVDRYNMSIDMKNAIKSLSEIKTENNSTQTILYVASFILNTQIIEYKIKESLSHLSYINHYQSFLAKSKYIKKDIKPEDIKLTLGKCIDALFNEYDSKELSEDLKSKLIKLSDDRNSVVHRLFTKFNSEDVLSKLAKDGIENTEKINISIDKLNKELVQEVFKNFGLYRESIK